MRVVAVDGTKFDKSGYVTGGSAGNLENAAAAFLAKEEEVLKAERAKLKAEQQVSAEAWLGAAACLVVPRAAHCAVRHAVCSTT